jgi:hypothetical protein
MMSPASSVDTSAIDAVLTIIEEMNHGTPLGEALEPLRHRFADPVAADAAERVVVELLRHLARTNRPLAAEHWTALFEGSSAHELPGDAMLDVLLPLAAEAGRVTLPELALLGERRFVAALVQLAVVVFALVTETGNVPARALLGEVRLRLMGTVGSNSDIPMTMKEQR